MHFDSQLLRVPSLSDDPGELHLSAGVHLKPMAALLGLRAPRAAEQVVLIVGALQGDRRSELQAPFR